MDLIKHTDHRMQFFFLLTTFWLLVIGCSSDGGSIPIDSGPFEPPYEGGWTSDSGQMLDIFDEVDNDDLLLTDYPISVFVANSPTTCTGSLSNNGLELTGKISDGKISLFSNSSPAVKCMEGEFTDLVTLKVTDLFDNTVSYFGNTRVEIALGTGLWESADHGGITLYMNQPRSINNDDAALVTGCIYNDRVESDSFSGNMTGFITRTKQRPLAQELKAELDGRILFKNLEFIDKKNMIIYDSNDRLFNLKRIAATDQDFDIQCP